MSTRPTRPLPSANGWISSNCGVRDGGLADRDRGRSGWRTVTRSSRRPGRSSGGGVTRWASNGEVPPIHPCSVRTTPTWRDGVGLPVISVRCHRHRPSTVSGPACASSSASVTAARLAATHAAADRALVALPPPARCRRPGRSRPR